MSFLNIPLKSIEATLISVTGVETMPWNNPLLYPVVPPALPPAPVEKDYRWRIEMNISDQQQSSYLSRNPGLYNGLDVNVGNWIGNLITGQAWQIITVEAKTSTTVTAIVQDIYRYNTFRDPSQVGNGAPGVGVYAIFNIGNTGVPEIDPVPPAGVSATFGINIQSRFQYINLQYDYPLYTPGNTFAYNDTIAADSTTHAFVLADDTNRLVVGRVTSVSDTIPGWFTINPVQKIVDNLDYLPGDVADIIYASLTTPGNITTTPGGSQLYIKLRNNTSSVSYSSLPGPTTADSILQLNNINITIPAPATVTQVISATNDQLLLTGVSASSVLAPSSVSTSNTLITPAYGEPALDISVPAVATINGISVSFDISSTDPGYVGYARAAQMAQSINNANIPDIVASTPSQLVLTITNIAGGTITIANVSPDPQGVNFAGTNSGSGLVLFTPTSIQSFIKFTAVDARAINFINVIGTTIEDFGLVSVENGVKACGLYIEEGLRQATLTVVTNLTQLNALHPLIGDQAYVIDSVDDSGNNNEEWSLWLYNGSQWILTGNQDSSTTDAKSLEYTVTIGSPSTINIGSISTGRRVALITVEVLTVFNGPATLSVGYQVNNILTPQLPVPAGLMDSSVIDLSIADTYTTSTDVLFGTDTVEGDVTITATFNNGTSTEGVAQIIVSYV